MGVPTLEVGYTSATTGRGDHEVHKGHVVALGEKINFHRNRTRIFDTLYCNRYMEFNCLLSVKVTHLIDRTDLFRVGGLVCNEFA
jgi:hypothetical protein